MNIYFTRLPWIPSFRKRIESIFGKELESLPLILLKRTYIKHILNFRCSGYSFTNLKQGCKNKKQQCVMTKHCSMENELARKNIFYVY